MSIAAVGVPSAPAPSLSALQRLKSIVGGSIGNLVEYYDWYVYTSFSLYFAQAFFPQGDAVAQALSAAAVFAVGFLMRPIGGWYFGRFADRHGRRASLMRSIVLMCAGSLLIAVCPTYASVGVAAPILLVLARLLQGLSLGGEYGSSATYLAEMATIKRRGFWSSFLYVTLIAGQLTALAVLIVLQHWVLAEEQLKAWGWRIPFAIGALIAIVALYLRRNMAETDAFTGSRGNAGTRRNGGSLGLLFEHWRAALIVIGLTMGGTLAFYTYTTYMSKFLVLSVGLDKETATLVNAATLFGYMLLQPLVGGLSDYIGRRPILIAFGVFGVLLTVPVLTTLEATRDPYAAASLIMLMLLVVSGYTAINAVVKAELFPVEIRALGVGLPYALAVAIFGGSAETVALWFKQIGHERGFYWYVTACIACSLLVYVFVPDTRKTSLIEDA
ncbi:MAG: MFS transporter [Proteobacteria bacterium]|uniref:MFS transporter n=1 Tax=Rudaea sp. TaxID=2136325 RepID=UPI0037838337|nr:MFS transporter [Pseudomonadota bacterium]